MSTSTLPLAEFGATHLVGIGGAGMSVIADLLAGHGEAVSGCDRAESAAAHDLRERGIPVSIGHSAAHLADIETLVVSTAARADNPDLVAARAAGLRVLHRSEALAGLIAVHHAVPDAGSQGKHITPAVLAAGPHGTIVTSSGPLYVILAAAYFM